MNPNRTPPSNMHWMETLTPPAILLDSPEPDNRPRTFHEGRPLPKEPVGHLTSMEEHPWARTKAEIKDQIEADEKIWNEEHPQSPSSNASPAKPQLSPEILRLICLIQERPVVGFFILGILQWVANQVVNITPLWSWRACQVMNRCQPGWDAEFPWDQPEIPAHLRAGWEWDKKTGNR